MSNTDNNAIELGFQAPFEVRSFTLGELLSMRTATTNEQTPLDVKRNEGLAQDLAAHGQLKPFIVLDLDGDLYLGGGRNRAYCHKNLLNRSEDMTFACLVYKSVITEFTGLGLMKYVFNKPETMAVIAVETKKIADDRHFFL